MNRETDPLPVGFFAFGFSPKYYSRWEKPPRILFSLGRKKICMMSVSSLRRPQISEEVRASRCLCCRQHETLCHGLCHSFHSFTHMHKVPTVCQLTAARVTVRDGKDTSAAPETQSRGKTDMKINTNNCFSGYWDRGLSRHCKAQQRERPEEAGKALWRKARPAIAREQGQEGP